MLDAGWRKGLRYPVRRTSHGTINTGTNPGKAPSGLRKKHAPPPPTDYADDAATQIDSPKTRSSLEDELFGLSIDQVSKLSGINGQTLKAYETTGGPDRLLYDHAVILARVLGVRPQEMPGLRPRETKDDVAGLIGELSRAVLQGPLITF